MWLKPFQMFPLYLSAVSLRSAVVSRRPHRSQVVLHLLIHEICFLQTQTSADQILILSNYTLIQM